MPTLNTRAQRVTAVIVIMSVLLLAGLIGTSTHTRVYDERWYLNYAEAVRDVGWYHAMTDKDNNHGSSVGPVYPAIHLAVSPLTKIQPPGARWVNFVCFLLVIVAVSRTLPGAVRPHALVGASSLLAVPFVWPTAGLALTEMPAMVFFSFTVLVMVKLIQESEAQVTPRSYGLAVVAGVLLGITILARQTYLVGVIAMLLLTVVAPHRWKLWLIAAATTMAVCTWLFVLWGGLIPPYQQYRPTPVSAVRLLQSLSYIAVATLFLDPKWLKPTNVRTALALIGVGAVISLLVFDFPDAPAQALIGRLGEPWTALAGMGILTAMTSLGVLWAWTAARRALADRRDVTRVFLFLLLFALVAAPAKGYIFSSRYVVAAVGILVLVLDLPRRWDGWLGVRIAVGSLLGAVSLLGYYRLG